MKKDNKKRNVPDTVVELPNHDTSSSTNGNNNLADPRTGSSKDGNGNVVAVPGDGFFIYITIDPPPTMPSESIPSNLQVIEDSFRALRFVNGFNLTYGNRDLSISFMAELNVSNIKPVIHLDPIIGKNIITNGPSLWVSKKRSGKYFCGLPASSSVSHQLTFQNDTREQQLMTTTMPTLNVCSCCCCCRKTRNRTAKILSPHSNEPMGLLHISSNKHAILENCLTKETFTIVKLKEGNAPAIKIGKKESNQVLAFGIATGGLKTTTYRNGVQTSVTTSWDEFKLFYFDIGNNLSVLDKALILAAFNIWVVEVKERESQQKSVSNIVSILTILLIFAGLGLFFYFLSTLEPDKNEQQPTREFDITRIAIKNLDTNSSIEPDVSVEHYTLKTNQDLDDIVNSLVEKERKGLETASDPKPPFMPSSLEEIGKPSISNNYNMDDLRAIAEKASSWKWPEWHLNNLNNYKNNLHKLKK